MAKIVIKLHVKNWTMLHDHNIRPWKYIQKNIEKNHGEIHFV